MIGTGEIVVILCVGLILFGGKRLPDFARNLGKGVREFKKALNGIEEDDIPTTNEIPQKTKKIAEEILIPKFSEKPIDSAKDDMSK